MQKKRILHLISGLEIGGAETQLLRILPKLQQYHENMVCCVRGHGPIGNELEKNGVPVRYLDFKGISDISVIGRFHEVVKKFAPDILVTYLIHADLYGRVFGRLFGIKQIVSSKRGALLQWEWLAHFDRFTKFMVTHYLVQTETARKEWLGRLKLPTSKFTVIPNGIDTESFLRNIDKPSKCAELGISPDAPIITCVARLRTGKGHEILLSAFEEVSKKYPAAKLLLVGDGEREQELRKQIDNYTSKDNIHFLGNRSDIQEILAVSDIFVLATEAEGMSNAIIEAMAAGKAIITTDIPENRELIEDKKTGILIVPKNTEEFRRAMIFLIEENAVRKKIGNNARIFSKERFNEKMIAKIFADFYSNLN